MHASMSCFRLLYKFLNDDDKNKYKANILLLLLLLLLTRLLIR
jgi:hypothetical protein